MELRYIKNRDEQLRIVRACHSDPTSGHLGFRKTLSRITERFTWRGVVKDAQEMVSSVIIILQGYYMEMHGIAWSEPEL